ncbi:MULTISPECIES: hypothetical protein [unclassified Paenibacillus]|nr:MULTISPECIES: hypothetical protein [unclassified Paenibacillus]EGL17509.1 hypothetical protein HMPREF9413_5386 [Paenibacillus sp. HGF7]EPD81285.1 hypothetical protein HMPREF1207_05042 [Paenibacillus sp. HGH0039]
MSKEFAMLGFAAAMMSDEMFVLRKKKEKVVQCPWMSDDNLMTG